MIARRAAGQADADVTEAHDGSSLARTLLPGG